jgi:hypothetical protein
MPPSRPCVGAHGSVLPLALVVPLVAPVELCTVFAFETLSVVLVAAHKCDSFV